MGVFTVSQEAPGYSLHKPKCSEKTWSLGGQGPLNPPQQSTGRVFYTMSNDDGTSSAGQAGNDIRHRIRGYRRYLDPQSGVQDLSEATLQRRRRAAKRGRMVVPIVPVYAPEHCNVQLAANDEQSNPLDHTGDRAEDSDHVCDAEACAEDSDHGCDAEACAEDSDHVCDAEVCAEDSDHGCDAEACAEDSDHVCDAEVCAEDSDHGCDAEACAEDSDHVCDAEASAEVSDHVCNAEAQLLNSINELHIYERSPDAEEPEPFRDDPRESQYMEDPADNSAEDVKLDEKASKFCRYSKFEVLMMILHYSERFTLSDVAVNALLDLVNIILGQKIISPTSYAFQKVFKSNLPIEVHSYCPSCTFYLGKKSDSGFPYENGIGYITKLTSGPQDPPVQMSRRYTTFFSIPSFLSKHPPLHPTVKQYCHSLLPIQRLKKAETFGEVTVLGNQAFFHANTGDYELFNEYGDISDLRNVKKVIFEGQLFAPHFGQSKKDDSFVRLKNGQYGKIESLCSFSKIPNKVFALMKQGF
ncbi:unnamed protein product [Bemisia tabaci]|uniref:Uncharacterized protein n=1 Tax=Bemisia tabaci TaxID=7038 RepID=A0A9P0AHF3_BEMTA|nr:unnamed protein product [Bemisia tabaci]